MSGLSPAWLPALGSVSTQTWEFTGRLPVTLRKDRVAVREHAGGLGSRTRLSAALRLRGSAGTCRRLARPGHQGVEGVAAPGHQEESKGPQRARAPRANREDAQSQQVSWRLAGWGSLGTASAPRRRTWSRRRVVWSRSLSRSDSVCRSCLGPASPRTHPPNLTQGQERPRGRWMVALGGGRGPHPHPGDLMG